MKLLQTQKADPDVLLCSDIETVQKENFDSFSVEKLSDVFEDFYQFSCSFVDKSKRNPKKPVS